MRKNFLIIFIVLLSSILCSCADTKVIDIPNITWKNEDFHIETTSEQLQKQFHEDHITGDNNYYPIIKICDESYSCKIYFANNDFIVTLYNPLNDTKTSFYGKRQEFLCGIYNLTKEERKEYKYSLKIELNDECQYYEYCMDNNIKYPNTIIFYGYENK